MKDQIQQKKIPGTIFPYRQTSQMNVPQAQDEGVQQEEIKVPETDGDLSE